MFKKKLILTNTYKLYKKDNFKQPKQYETIDQRKRDKERSMGRNKDNQINSDKKLKKGKVRLVNNLFKTRMNINSTQDLTDSNMKMYGDVNIVITPHKKLKNSRMFKSRSNKKKVKR